MLDCFQEGGKDGKESLTITDINSFVHKRLRGLPQTPSLTVFQLEGDPIEIANFREKLALLAEQERVQLISTARGKLSRYVATGDLSEEQVESVVRLLESNEARLFPPERLFRDNVIRFLKRELKFYEAFGTRQMPELPLKEPKIDRPVAPRTSEVLPATGGGGKPQEAVKPILIPPPPKALVPTLVAIGLVIIAISFYFFLLNQRCPRYGESRTFSLSCEERF